MSRDGSHPRGSSPPDDRDHIMAMIEDLSDHEIDELIAGRTPPGLYELKPIADVADAVRRHTAKEQVPVADYALRLALLRAVEGRAGRGSTAPTPPRTAAPLAVPSHRRRLIGLSAACVALVALATASAANALPSPVQNVVAKAGDLVGIDVPEPEDDEPVTTTGDGDGGSTSDADGSRDGAGPSGDEGEPGSQATTDGGSGGATPADPGTPGDKAPATPATPPEHSNGGNPNGTGPGSGNGQGQGNGNGNGTGPGSGNGRGQGNGNG